MPGGAHPRDELLASVQMGEVVKRQSSCCPGVSRRSFLLDTGMGFTGLALGAMLFGERAKGAPVHGTWTPPDGRAHFAPRAKSVIWIFLCGGVSHLESFDPKPALNQYAGKSADETPYKDLFDSGKV